MAALEQWSAITFCVANQKPGQETFEILETAFPNNTMKKTASNELLENLILVINLKR